ncbi:myosin-binding protein 3-like [Cynara cardunculus var. scolymus]|nr:myosin-binding protein 3-like [Cynara cardunculus var. scolymus]
MVQAMDLPVENKSSGHIQVFDQIIPLEWTDSSTSCSTTSAGSNGHESMVCKHEDQVQEQDGRFLKSSDCQDEGDKAGISIDSLMAELKAERLAVYGLYIQLDEERNVSAIAAKQAMATITRLEEEKVAVQIESKHNQRMMNEQAEYDQEVVQLLNELVMKLENEKVELENEVEMYKEKLLDNSSSSSKESSRTVEESIWILDELKDCIRKASLDESYKGNRLFHLFDHEGMNLNEQDDEASHSAWRQTSL